MNDPLLDPLQKRVEEILGCKLDGTYVRESIEKLCDEVDRLKEALRFYEPY